MSKGGDLGFVDQINDTRDTRFDGISALDQITSGLMTLLTVGGSDGFVSLFRLLPNGRLVLPETLEDSLATAMGSIRQLRFVEQQDCTVELLELAKRYNGSTTRFEVDTGAVGISATGRAGGAGNDGLTSSSEGMLLNGAGSTVWAGAAGEDALIFAPDKQNDTIRNFDITEDKIDLNGYGLFYDISSLLVAGRPERGDRV